MSGPPFAPIKIQLFVDVSWEKMKEIWLIPMTESRTPTEKPTKQHDKTKNVT